MVKKRVFITEYVGLSTRLEALAIAFMISDQFGHEVCIDWRELDALSVQGARIRSRGLLGRLNSLKLLMRMALSAACQAASVCRDQVI